MTTRESKSSTFVLGAATPGQKIEREVDDAIIAALKHNHSEPTLNLALAARRLLQAYTTLAASVSVPSRAPQQEEKAMTLHCCFSACDKHAEFVIYTLRRGGPAELAGPDPYADETHACEDHAGLLLGHQPEARNPEEIFWEVRTI